MRVLRAILLVPVLFALLVAGAAAASTSAGLDTSFGNGGKITVAVLAAEYGRPTIEGVALSPDGRTYVLSDSGLIAFEADGAPATGFGSAGQVAFEPSGSEGRAEGLAVDSEGRVLVTGTVELGGQKRGGLRVGYTPLYAVYVIRLLADGNRDLTFGEDGEVQTTFDLPRPSDAHGVKYKLASATATSIAVDHQNRPIIGGGFAQSYGGCESGLIVPAPFVGRLTATGALDTSFAGKGYALLGGHGDVSALARTPDGGAATLSFGISCGARTEEEPSRFSAFTESGEAPASLDPNRPKFYAGASMAIDPQGRILVVRTTAPAAEGRNALVRLLPDGDVDRSFGKNGAVVLKGVLSELGAFTVDAQGRPILARAGHQIELRRLTSAGAIDPTFSPGGRLFAKGAWAQAVALDGDGRIYTVGAVKGPKLKTGYGVQVARFIPGS